MSGLPNRPVYYGHPSGGYGQPPPQGYRAQGAGYSQTPGYSQAPPGYSQTAPPTNSYTQQPPTGGYQQPPQTTYGGGYGQAGGGQPPPASSYSGYGHAGGGPPPATASYSSYGQGGGGQPPPASPYGGYGQAGGGPSQPTSSYSGYGQGGSYQQQPPSNNSFSGYGQGGGYHQQQTNTYGQPSSQHPPTNSYTTGSLPPSQGTPYGAQSSTSFNPGYAGQAQVGPPPGMDPTLWEWFQAVDSNHSGTITAVELREALLNSNWSHFNEETCRLLIGMFDNNGNGKIDVHEFGSLWKYVQDWKGCFDKFDTDKSGNISADELHKALLSFGYRLSMEFCSVCTRVFDRKNLNSMNFDDFIQCCVMLRSLTEKFKEIDTDQDGIIDVSYEQFLEMAIDNTVQKQ